ncbi:MAG: beta strand repeat-containing protein, partial [Myxococcaceae bacterium]
MNARWGEWRSGLVVTTLAILGGSGCTGVYSGPECGGPDQACCVGNTCSGSMVCGPESRCATAAPMYSVGGTVSGLTGSGLTLRNGTDTLGIAAAGPFTFPTALPSGSPYAVSISNQPAGQSCSLSGGSGIVGSDNVTSVAVSCTSTPARTYTIGGSVTGLTGTGLVLQDNGADNLPIAGNGAFRFATELTHGDRYEITVLIQPSGQTCTVINGSGTVGSADVTGVAVSCVENPTPRYTIGGMVSGLAGTGLLLRNNGTDDLPISANGAFTFTTALPTGASYAVTVAGQPGGPSQTCAVSSGAGTVGRGNVTGVVVQCVTNPVPKFTVGGTVTGLSGPGLVLRNNGGDDLALATSGSFTFATPLTSGSPYSVTILSQPSGQTCSVSGGTGTVNGSNVISVAVSCISNPPPRYSVGGTVTGLTGAGLVLRNNGADDLSLGTSGPFAFATALTGGSAYAVTVATQPSGQTCTVSNGSGIIGSANVTSVVVSCITDPLPTYTVGGTVSGLNGPGLVLQDNGADNLSIGGNGPFAFSTALTGGDHYSVTVLSQPAGQTCAVSGGSGTIGSANVTSVVVGCVTNPIPKYRVGGVVSGLAGTGLVLRNNGGDQLAVGTDGPFSFATSLPTGASYSVTVSGQPTGPSQTCTVSNGSGTVGSTDVTTVAVTCVTNPLPRYTIGGTVTGLSGTGLVLRDNGGDDLAVTSSGTFTFATSLASGSAYAVTVASQPSGQTCTVSNGSGTVASANVTSVSVSCITNPPPRYTVGGAVSGLTGTGLVLRNNGGDDLAITANGAFTFSTPLTSGSAYSVTVFRQPSGQSCTVSGGSGTVVGANVTGVSVSCVANRYTIGGTVSGLTGTGLVLRNNGGDDLGIPASGTFTFATALTTGSLYAVTVASQPSGQTCSVLNGSGTVAGANVTNVSVSCTANRYTIGGTVSGLTGTGLVLRNNGGDDLAVASNGAFTFATSLISGSTYAVTVAIQPSGQTCSVTNATGTVAGANITTIGVACITNPPPRYTIGG